MIDETVTYIVRTIMLALLLWIGNATVDTRENIKLLEWRVGQVEMRLMEQGQ